VERGEYLTIATAQGTRDVEVILADSAGKQRLAIDSLAAASASSTLLPDEELHWVAEAAGEVRIEARLVAGAPGSCPLRLLARRPATAEDRERAAAETDLARAHALRRSQDVASCGAAVAPYRRAEGRFARLRLPRRRAEALFGLGRLEQECSRRNREALAAFTAALPFYAGDADAEAGVRERLGEAHFALGELEEAVAHYRLSLALRRRLGDRVGEALTSNNLGHALHLLGHYDEAATLLDRALALWREDDSAIEHAKTHLNRGQLHRDLGENELARSRFAEALRLSRRAKDDAGEAAAYNALALISLDEGRPAAALAPLTAALPLRAPESRGRAVTLASLGVAYRQLGRLEEARRVYLEALPIFRMLGDAREEAKSLGNLGWLELSAGRSAPAGADFDRALALYAQLGDPPGRAWILGGRARLLRRGGDLAAASEAMEEALTEVERQRSRQEEGSTRAAFFSTQQGYYDFLVDLLMEQHAREPSAGYDAAALAINERAQARSLLDALAASGTDPRRGSDTALPVRESALEGEIDALNATESLLNREGRATREQTLRIAADLARRRRELDRVRAALRAGRSRYATLSQPRAWSAADIERRLLDRDTLLLEYRLGDEHSYLWVLGAGSLASFQLPGRAILEELTRDACDRLARGYGRKAEVAAGQQLAQLSAKLLGPVAGLLPGKRLLIVSDGALRDLPFAALPEPGSGEPLIAGHEIVSLPSASVLGELRREVAGRAPAPKALWVLAHPDFGPAFPALPKTLEEADALLALVPAAERSALLGPAASRDAILSGPLRDYRLLHFATHGSYEAGDPGGVRLVLAQRDAQGRPRTDGFLHLADIYGLDLRADLVTLSACESARGSELRGEGLVGMTRGFLYAGAERVVVSLWNVSEQAGVELMRRFYEGMLRDRLSPAAALRAAQNAIRGERGWSSPYYWAGFTLHGEWRGGPSATKPAPGSGDLSRKNPVTVPRRSR
jgi:CHAT domain-containing protein/Tfp pilus assembly protein PilF